MIPFAFWGRCSTEDRQDPEASRAWQIRRAKALIEPRGGVIVAEYFDVDKSRSIPPQRRPEANLLLAALASPDRDFDAVVVGEPQRAFYGNQFGNTFPVFEHYSMPLWVPEVGGPIDPANEAHELIMSMFAGISKGERNRIKIRVRTTMAALAQIEGRFLGGRPPYGYLLADAGPHPNPAKAADGKRLSRLEIDPETGEVVRSMFAWFINDDLGIYAIAERLTRAGIPCPSAHDPDRNKHRSGVAWSKGAVRAILTNPRYTGYQVWNRQRTDEVLLDVENVALGNTAKMRWNPADQWIFSDKIVHPPIISKETFDQAQAILAGRGSRTPHKQHARARSYTLRGILLCGLCDRRMTGNWNNGEAYYRCRYPAEYALANDVSHPKTVYLREAELTCQLDDWLAESFEPAAVRATLAQMAAQSGDDPAITAITEATRAKIAGFDRQLSQYRATLDAGGDPEVVGPWIAEVQAKRVAAQAQIRTATGRRTMTAEEINAMVTALGDLVQVLTHADPEDKADAYAQLGVSLIYRPQRRLVEATAKPGHNMCKGSVSEGGLEPPCP